MFSNIREHVKDLLLSEIEQKSRFFFENAKKIIIGNSRKVEILKDIYHNPDCYAGYFLMSEPGHLGKQGDSHAEKTTCLI